MKEGGTGQGLGQNVGLVRINEITIISPHKIYRAMLGH